MKRVSKAKLVNRWCCYCIPRSSDQYIGKIYCCEINVIAATRVILPSGKLSLPLNHTNLYWYCAIKGCCVVELVSRPVIHTNKHSVKADHFLKDCDLKNYLAIASNTISE
jgi:hypothetical protein